MWHHAGEREDRSEDGPEQTTPDSSFILAIAKIEQREDPKDYTGQDVYRVEAEKNALDVHVYFVAPLLTLARRRLRYQSNKRNCATAITIESVAIGIA